MFLFELIWDLGALASNGPQIVPQTVLALRGSHGVGIEAAMDGLWIRPRRRSLIFVAIYGTW